MLANRFACPSFLLPVRVLLAQSVRLLLEAILTPPPGKWLAAGEFDNPGFLGFLTFVLPLIVDGICSGLAPAVFAPNALRLLQNADLSFSQVR